MKSLLSPLVLPFPTIIINMAQRVFVHTVFIRHIHVQLCVENVALCVRLCDSWESEWSHWPGTMDTGAEHAAATLWSGFM